MRNKKVFSFAVEIITNGFPNGLIDYTQMYLVAKYFRNSLGCGAVKLEREVIKFCIAQDKNFNPVIDAKAIKKWVRSAMNYDLRKIESVTISQKEIDFLKSIDGIKDRKLLFMSLILSKALKKRSTRHAKTTYKTSDNYYIHYNNFLDIVRLSGIKNIGEIDLANVFNRHKEHLTFYNVEKELIRIDYADKDSSNGIIIDNLDKTLEYYELFFGKQTVFSYCGNCGREIIKNNNKQKYCKNCARLLEKERKAKWKKANE